MKNTLIVLAVLILVGVGGFFFMNRPNSSPKETQKEEVNNVEGAATGQSDEASPTTGEAMEKGTKEFTVQGSNFVFDVKEMKVTKGDTVKLTFVNMAGMHDWVIDQFNARTKQIQAGQSETVTFVADKAGSFEYYCSVGKHRENGMKGNLIVE